MKRYSKQYWSTNPLTLYLLNTKSQENNRPLFMTLAVQALARQARQCTLQVIGSTGPGETGTTMYTTGDWQYRPWLETGTTMYTTGDWQYRPWLETGTTMYTTGDWQYRPWLETGTTMYTTGDWQYRPWRDRHDNVHYRWYGNIIIPIQRGEHYKKGATLSEALIHFTTQE